MPQQRILVVEDDKNIAKLIKYNLEEAGFECETAQSGEKALPALKFKPADLIILDIMLPGIDGFEVCKLLKADDSFKKIPVMILTAKGEETDRIVGLELGADDYVVKPFSPRELVLRVKAILKRGRTDNQDKDVLLIDDILVDIPRHMVSVKKKKVELTQLEFRLLCLLIERRGRVQTREKLLSDVWNMDADVDTRTIDTHIKRLREKLGKPGDCIETVRGLGYKIRDDDED